MRDEGPLTASRTWLHPPARFDTAGDAPAASGILLPTGTIRALKKHLDAIAVVVIVSGGLTALGIAHSSLSVIAIVGLGLAAYCIRRRTAETHERAIGEQKVRSELAKADQTKARHLDLLIQGQPSLPFAPSDTTSSSFRRTDR